MGRSLPGPEQVGSSRDLLFMKKGWAPVLITFAAAALGLFGIRFVRGRGGLQVRDFLPAETVFLLHVPNAETTLRRWKSTALAAMGDEPEVRSFLAKPRAALLRNEVFAEGVKAWTRVVPSEGFVALATLTDAEPKGVAGLRFAGSQDRVMELHARVKRKISRRFPQAQTQVLTPGASDLEVLTLGAVTFASATLAPLLAATTSTRATEAAELAKAASTTATLAALEAVSAVPPADAPFESAMLAALLAALASADDQLLACLLRVTRAVTVGRLAPGGHRVAT
jgi:hypothetical protein